MAFKYPRFFLNSNRTYISQLCFMNVSKRTTHKIYELKYLKFPSKYDIYYTDIIHVFAGPSLDRYSFKLTKILHPHSE